MMTRRAALLLGMALPGLALAQGTPRAAELDQLFAVLRDSQDAAPLGQAVKEAGATLAQFRVLFQPAKAH